MSDLRAFWLMVAAIAPLLLTGCTTTRSLIEHDPQALQQANAVALVFFGGCAVACVAWAAAWAYVNRNGDQR